MATSAQIKELRLMLGEPLEESESLFSDEVLDSWIDEEVTMQHAILKGWKAKMAHFANLVDVSDGASARAFSDLLKNAESMVTNYTKITGRAGRSRVGRIIRST